MSSPLPVLETARAIASIAADGARELNELLTQKFILPKIEAIPNLDVARKYFQALGATQFHSYTLRMSDAKIRKVLEVIGCAKGSTRSLTDVQLRDLLRDFASGTLEAYPPAGSAGAQKKAPARARAAAQSAAAKPAAPLPDVRALYRSGGVEAAFKAIKPLKVAELRALISGQSLKALPKGTSRKEDMLKHIQTALRDELGVRGDWIGAVSRRRDDEGV